MATPDTWGTSWNGSWGLSWLFGGTPPEPVEEATGSGGSNRRKPQRKRVRQLPIQAQTIIEQVAERQIERNAISSESMQALEKELEDAFKNSELAFDEAYRSALTTIRGAKIGREIKAIMVVIKQKHQREDDDLIIELI